MDSSLTEKLKSAFEDSLAEIGRRYLLELNKLKRKNDDYKKKQKLVQAQNKPKDKQQGTAKGKTLTGQGIGNKNKINNNKQSTFQGKTPSVKEKGEGITPQNKPNNKQRSASQGRTLSEQKIGENELSEDKQCSTFQGKTPVQEKVGEGRPPQDIAEEKKSSKEFVHPFTKKTNAETNGVAGYGQTRKQQVSAGSSVAQNISKEHSNVQVRIPQTCVPVSRHSQPGSPRCLVHLGSPHNPSMRLNIPLCGW
jgi:hypothetical protein